MGVTDTHPGPDLPVAEALCDPLDIDAARVAAMVEQAQSRLDGMLFTATPTQDLGAVITCQHLANQAFALMLRTTQPPPEHRPRRPRARPQRHDPPPPRQPRRHRQPRGQEPAAAVMVFQLVSRRYERGSMIITSNKSFAQRGRVHSDDVLTTAILDRLLHHCDVLATNGPSYRLKDRLALVPGGGPMP